MNIVNIIGVLAFIKLKLLKKILLYIYITQ